MPKVTVQIRPQEGDSTNICTLDPVAQALRAAVGLKRAEHPHDRNRIYPGTTRAEAFSQPSRLFATGPNGIIKCETPPAVRDWILAWDATGEGEALDFVVDMAAPRPNYRPPLEYQIPGIGHFERQRPSE